MAHETLKENAMENTDRIVNVINVVPFFFFYGFYVFIHERQRERGRDIGRGRSKLPAGFDLSLIHI